MTYSSEMASIFGPGIVIRYFFGFARNLVFNVHRETEGNVIKGRQTLYLTINHGFATSIENTHHLGQSTKKLNKEVPIQTDDSLNNSTKSSQANPNTRIKDESLLLDLMVKHVRIADVTKQVTNMIHGNYYSVPRILRFYLNQIAETGNYSLLEEIYTWLSPDLKKNLSFENRFCHAYTAAGKSQDYLNRMIEKFTKAQSKEELDLIEEEFPRTAINGLLEKNPELFTTYEKFVEQLAEKGFYTPINIIWMQHIENGKLEQANLIMKTYLVHSPIIMYMHTSRMAVEKKDENIAKNLLQALKESKLSGSSIGSAHSCIINVFCMQTKFDEAIQALDNALKDVPLKRINRMSLLRLKDGLEKMGMQFPYVIPEKKIASATNNRSRSDYDEPVKSK